MLKCWQWDRYKNGKSGTVFLNHYCKYFKPFSGVRSYTKTDFFFQQSKYKSEVISPSMWNLTANTRLLTCSSFIYNNKDDKKSHVANELCISKPGQMWKGDQYKATSLTGRGSGRQWSIPHPLYMRTYSVSLPGKLVRSLGNMNFTWLQVLKNGLGGWLWLKGKRLSEPLLQAPSSLSNFHLTEGAHSWSRPAEQVAAKVEGGHHQPEHSDVPKCPPPSFFRIWKRRRVDEIIPPACGDLHPKAEHVNEALPPVE